MMAALQQSRGVTLAALLPELASTTRGDHPVTGLSADSRSVRPGDAFLAFRGDRYDGRRFIDEAVQHGAAAVLVEQDAQWTVPSERAGVPVLPVLDLRQRSGAMASRFHGEPSRGMRVTGVTGTNGKTTVTHLAARVAAALGVPAGVIGTLGWGTVDALAPTRHTTPDVLELHALLAELHARRQNDVMMEVSSHALAQGRVNGVAFHTAVLTNLSHDHLDYHGSVDAYAAAKQRLFEIPHLRHALVNLDDPMGRALPARIPQRVAVLGYSQQDPMADLFASNVRCTATGLEARVETPWGDGVLRSPLQGAFNLANCLAVIGVLCLQEHPLEAVLAELARQGPVAGRLEPMANTRGLQLLVDYAHTPDALNHVLQTLRSQTRGRLIVVFGCGGDRDREKRPVMGRIAGDAADRVILTSDNPRHEPPEAILDDILRGMGSLQHVTVESDRAHAIHGALAEAREGDTVLVAGKGHERFQQVGDERLPFSDRAVIEAWLKTEGAA